MNAASKTIVSLHLNLLHTFCLDKGHGKIFFQLNNVSDKKNMSMWHVKISLTTSWLCQEKENLQYVPINQQWQAEEGRAEWGDTTHIQMKCWSGIDVRHGPKSITSSETSSWHHLANGTIVTGLSTAHNRLALIHFWKQISILLWGQKCITLHDNTAIRVNKQETLGYQHKEQRHG